MFMKLTEEELKKAKSLTDPSVKKLVEFYEFVMLNHVAYESYVSRIAILNKWNKELAENPISITPSTKTKLDDEKEVSKREKEVAIVQKYMNDQPSLLEGTEKIKSYLTPKDIERAESAVKLGKDLAFG